VDATIVERLRDAGAVLCAKLVDGALAQGGVWFGGSTRNRGRPTTAPADVAGPGPANAAGLVAFAIGTETRGSIISPSSTCGVVGLRPTYGRVSRYGAMALSWSMDKIGRCAGASRLRDRIQRDLRSDGRDDTVVDAPFTWTPEVPLSSLKIGFLESEFNATNAGGGVVAAGGRGESGGRAARAEERNKLLKDALDVLRAAGAKLEPMTLARVSRPTRSASS